MFLFFSFFLFLSLCFYLPLTLGISLSIFGTNGVGTGFEHGHALSRHDCKFADLRLRLLTKGSSNSGLFAASCS